MSEIRVEPNYAFEVIRRQRWIIAAIFLGTFMFSVVLGKVLPKIYQSESVIHIALNYFQNPILGDLISQHHDPSEILEERTRIIRSALSTEFATRMGEKYELFTTSADSADRPAEVDFILKTLEISNINSSEFKLTYKSRKAEIADGIMRDAMSEIRDFMYHERLATLEQLKRVLDADPSLPLSVGSGGSRGGGANGDEIRKLNAQIENLRNTYSDQHPSIAALRDQVAALKRGQSGAKRSDKSSLEDLVSESRLKDDLDHQKHQINVALEIEKKDPTMSNYFNTVKAPVLPKSPIFPKMKLFIMFGLVGGVVISTLAAALVEYFQRGPISPALFSTKLKLPVLGRLFFPRRDS